MPQSGQDLLFLPHDDRASDDVSEKAGDDSPEQSDDDDGDRAGDDDLDDDMLRSTGCVCWYWLLHRARIA